MADWNSFRINFWLYALAVLGSVMIQYREKIPFIKQIPLPILAVVMFIVLFGLLTYYSKARFGLQKNVKSNLLGAPILLFFLILGIAYFTKNGLLMTIDFLIFFPAIFLFLFFYTFLIPRLRVKKRLRDFSLKFNIPLQEKSSEKLPIPEIFYNDFGKIPFNKLSFVMKVSSNFFIFINSYIRSTRRIGRNAFEKQLTFFFSINPMKGYHRIFLRNPVLPLEMTGIETLTNSESPYVKTNDNLLDENYIVLSKDEISARKILQSIKEPLLEISKIIPNNIVRGVDGVSTNMEITITDKYVLARMDDIYASDVEKLYPYFVEIQKLLSI